LFFFFYPPPPPPQKKNQKSGGTKNTFYYFFLSNPPLINSSIFSSRWAKIAIHTKTWLSRLVGSARKVLIQHYSLTCESHDWAFKDVHPIYNEVECVAISVCLHWFASLSMAIYYFHISTMFSSSFLFPIWHFFSLKKASLT
jgi:hypothetical protein